MAAGGHPVHANAVEVDTGGKARVLRHRVDGARDFGGPLLPAIGAGLAGSALLSPRCSGRGDDKALVDQRAGEIGMHPNALTVRDHRRRPLLRAVAGGASTARLSSNGPRCTFCSAASVG